MAGYFDNFKNVHRLANENLIRAVEERNLDNLDEAETYAEQGIDLAGTLPEKILAAGILNTIVNIRITLGYRSETPSSVGGEHGDNRNGGIDIGYL